jgi:hypothetical protein
METRDQFADMVLDGRLAYVDSGGRSMLTEVLPPTENVKGNKYFNRERRNDLKMSDVPCPMYLSAPEVIKVMRYDG